MTIEESLRSISSYPIPANAVRAITDGIGLYGDDTYDQLVAENILYKRAMALVYLFLSEAPNVSQGGISFSFSSDERKSYKLKAEKIFSGIGEEEESGIAYGYMGSDL